MYKRILVATDVASRRDKLKTLPANRLGAVRELLADYNSKAKPEERFQSALPHLYDDQAFDACYGPLVLLGRFVSTLHADFEGIGLYNNRNAAPAQRRAAEPEVRHGPLFH